MKVYRFLRWQWRSTDLKKGSLNEFNNMNDYNLISPSYTFLKVMSEIPIYLQNSFGREREMTKYFFLSLADAVAFAVECKTENIIIEVDIPDEILRKCIGMGVYNGYENHVEFRLPYETLYDCLAKDHQDYFYEALAFYNAHLYSNCLNRNIEYGRIESLLEKVPSKDIHMRNCLSIYPLFCFEPTDITMIKIPLTNENRPYCVAQDMQKIREARYAFNETISKIGGSDPEHFTYQERFSKDELFDFSVPIIEEENEALRRILLKKD